MISENLIKISKILRKKVNSLEFSAPVEYVYNPLDYAWEPYSMYIKKFTNTRKKIIFLGMNPGPWGMAQVGVPFGEISLVKNWLGIEARVVMVDKFLHHLPRQ